MATPMETEIENWRTHLADAKSALDEARRRLAENRRDMAALRRGLQEAQDRLNAISAAEAGQKQRIHREP